MIKFTCYFETSLVAGETSEREHDLYVISRRFWLLPQQQKSEDEKSDLLWCFIYGKYRSESCEYEKWDRFVLCIGTWKNIASNPHMG